MTELNLVVFGTLPCSNSCQRYFISASLGFKGILFIAIITSVISTALLIVLYMPTTVLLGKTFLISCNWFYSRAIRMQLMREIVVGCTVSPEWIPLLIHTCWLIVHAWCSHYFCVADINHSRPRHALWEHVLHCPEGLCRFSPVDAFFNHMFITF